MNDDQFFVFAIIFLVLVVGLVVSESRRDDDRARNDMREFGEVVGRRSHRRRPHIFK